MSRTMQVPGLGQQAGEWLSFPSQIALPLYVNADLVQMPAIRHGVVDKNYVTQIVSTQTLTSMKGLSRRDALWLSTH